MSLSEEDHALLHAAITREQRRAVYALNKAGCSRKRIAERMCVPLSEVLKTIGADKEPDRNQKLKGTWRVLGKESMGRDPWDGARFAARRTRRGSGA